MVSDLSSRVNSRSCKGYILSAGTLGQGFYWSAGVCGFLYTVFATKPKHKIVT